MIKIFKITGCWMCPNKIHNNSSDGIDNCGVLFLEDVESMAKKGKGISDIDGSKQFLDDCPLENYENDNR